eukprot:g70791.t1
MPQSFISNSTLAQIIIAAGGTAVGICLLHRFTNARTSRKELRKPLKPPPPMNKDSKSKARVGSDGKPKKVCIIGCSGKLGRYMVQHCLDRGYTVVGVCRTQSVGKVKDFTDSKQLTVFPGDTNDRKVVEAAVKDCDAVLTVLAPWGVRQYSSTTAQAVMDFAKRGARLIFSCGWHITYDGKDKYGMKIHALVWILGGLARLARIVELRDQVTACELIFNSDKKWTVVRGSDLEEGESEGLPVWSEHVQDPVLASNITRRIDFALFMVDAIDRDELIQKAPAIVSCQSPSALQHARQ